MKHKENGVVEAVGDLQSGTGKTGREWRKREIIVNIAAAGSQWPNPVKVTFWNDKEGRAACLSVGDEVEIEFLIRGSEYNGRYKVELNGYEAKITRKNPDAQASDSDEEPGVSESTLPDTGDPDDLPF